MGSLKKCSTYCRRNSPQSKLFDCNGTWTLWPSMVLNTSRVPVFLADHSLCKYSFSVATTAAFFEWINESNMRIAGRLTHLPSPSLSDFLVSGSGVASSAESSLSSSIAPLLNRSLSRYSLGSVGNMNVLVKQIPLSRSISQRN